MIISKTTKCLSIIFVLVMFSIQLPACDQEPYCGDWEMDIDLGEQCDTNDFGGQNCVTFDFSGGKLYCQSNCTVDTNSCHNCDMDPCSGENCSGHGRCIVSGCSATCQCDSGYVLESGDECVQDTSCTPDFSPCSTDEECCSGRCYEDLENFEFYCL